MWVQSLVMTLVVFLFTLPVVAVIIELTWSFKVTRTALYVWSSE